MKVSNAIQTNSSSYNSKPQQNLGLSVLQTNKLKNDYSHLNMPNYKHFSSSVNFNGLYDPTKLKMSEICSGLKGWTNKSKLLGPNYLTENFVTRDLVEFLKAGNHVSAKTKNYLTEMKAHTSNFQAFCTGASTTPRKEYKEETEQFLKTLKNYLPTLNKTIKDIKLPQKETAFLHKFIAETAPTLHSMGYGDAIAHSTQVTRKCMLEAYKSGGNNQEILQAGIVGWLHDPKFTTTYSWSNLATHPAIAGSLGNEILNNPQIKNELLNIFNGDKAKTKNFIEGTAEALFVNNDSAFVLNTVVLHKFEYVPNSEKGIADLIEGAEELAQKRFIAPSKGEEPPQFSERLKEQLNKVSLDTGIKGISLNKLGEILNELGAKHPKLKITPQKFWDKLLSGEIKNKKLLSHVKNKLEADNGIKSVRINGDNLFSHHMEVEKAKLAAQNLIIADPMLLSPHKILLEGTQNTAHGRLVSFSKSFANNIKYITQEYQDKAKSWQKKVYMSLIESADELTSGSALEKFEKSASSIPMDEQISTLLNIIEDEKTFGNYANLNPKNTEQLNAFKKLAETIKHNYGNMAENSSEMFAV